MLERLHQFDHMGGWYPYPGADDQILNDGGSIRILIDTRWSPGGKEVDNERLGCVPDRGVVRRHPHNMFGREFNFVGTQGWNFAHVLTLPLEIGPRWATGIPPLYGPTPSPLEHGRQLFGLDHGVTDGIVGMLGAVAVLRSYWAPQDSYGTRARHVPMGRSGRRRQGSPDRVKRSV